MTSLSVRTHWHHPEWVATAVSVAAWALLLGLTLTGRADLVATHAPLPPLETVGQALVMAAAMMTPLVLDQARHVAVSSLWKRRYRTILVFLAGYLTVWTVIGTMLMFAASLVVGLVGWHLATATSFVAAAFVTQSRSHARWLRQCWATGPLAISGWRADLDALKFGVTTALPCVAVTAPLMWAAAVAHGLVVMTAVTAVMVLERRRPPREARRLVPSVLAIGAAALLLGSIGMITGSEAVSTHVH